MGEISAELQRECFNKLLKRNKAKTKVVKDYLYTEVTERGPMDCLPSVHFPVLTSSPVAIC